MNINELAFESDDPFKVFEKWYEAYLGATDVDSNAMVLSTVGQDLQPHSRVVLLKSFDRDGFVFFTNYGSSKGNDIQENPKASLLFYTNKFERQIRIQGEIEKTSSKVSDDYFQSRPRESQIGAIASEQSSQITSRAELINKYEDLLKEYTNEVPRPENWGGYVLKPDYFEFWMKGEHRLHDRVVFDYGFEEWEKYYLAP